MKTPARILGLGAAAPTLRLAAADVGAAWGRRGGKARVAACAPDEDTLTLA
ncbi:MAG: ACP synthase, partial [Actinobacteria bacterium]|nr:ACP synthase [Actinomycetota bacterium]